MFLVINMVGIMGLNEVHWRPLEPSFGYVVSNSPTVIGMQVLYSANIVVRQPGVSRRHAQVFQENGDWFVEDMGSDNGTWLIKPESNDKIRLATKTKLYSNMFLLFGALVTKIEIRDDLAEA